MFVKCVLSLLSSGRSSRSDSSLISAPPEPSRPARSGPGNFPQFYQEARAWQLQSARVHRNRNAQPQHSPPSSPQLQ